MKCDICNKTIKSDGCGTGYSTSAEGKRVCYACCADLDRKAMNETGQATLYLLLLGGTKGEVTNWPGSLRFSCGVKQGRHNFGIPRYDAWFDGPDGHIWHGVNIGDFSQICHCKRTKQLSA